MPQKYPQQFRDRAIRMVTDRLEHDDAPSRYVVTQEVARKLGIAAEKNTPTKNLCKSREKMAFRRQDLS